MDTEIQPVPDYQIRVKEELRELQEKINKLETFIRADMRYLELPPIDRGLLRAQHSNMVAYASVLTIRINRWQDGR